MDKVQNMFFEAAWIFAILSVMSYIGDILTWGPDMGMKVGTLALLVGLKAACGEVAAGALVCFINVLNRQFY